MKTYFVLFLIAAFTSAAITPLLRRLCQRLGLVAGPRSYRHVHQTPIPRLGGVGLYLSVAIALSSLFFVHNLLTQNLRGEIKPIGGFLLCSLLVVALGAYDDLRGANAIVKLVAMAAVAMIFYALGGRIAGLSIPFIGQITLHPIVGCLLTLVWVVAIANAFNLIDGVDGLATGSALFSSLVLLTISLMQGRSLLVVILLALTGSLAGFLRYNFNPASIFLGDSGSLFVGFALAALSIMGSQKASTAVAVAIPLLAFGLPVVDATVTVGRRFLSGKPIFQGDREHIHHMLLARGWSQRRVALVLYAVSAAFGLAAMMFVNGGSGMTAVMLFVLGVAVALALGNLRYHEVDELRASVRRNIGDRRTRAINNLRLRRACQTLHGANTLDELFKAVTEVLELGEFVYATAQLSCHGHVQINARAFELADANGFADRASLIDGCVRWAWQRHDITDANVIGSEKFWALRLPLAVSDHKLGYLNFYRPLSAEPLRFDINYLTDVFHPAVSNGAARVFAHAEQSMPRQMAATAR